MIKYDAIVIGSGQAGSPLARKLAGAGWKVAIIERQWVGGTCINTGCTPTKTLIASGHVARLIQRSDEYGIHTRGATIDIEAVVKRKNAVVLASRESSTRRLLETPNLDLIFGSAVFSGPREVTVTREDGSRSALTAEKIFINTGTRAQLPPVPGLDSVNYLTSSTLLDLLEIPEHLVIMGGSYIALEFGQLYRRLGSKVTILESKDQFLPKEDTDIALEIRKILEEEGLTIITGARVVKVSGEGRHISLEMETSGSVTGSHLLVATGRAPDTMALNPGAAGILLDDHGFITVNDRLETNVPGIYALGDVKGGPQFTHISYNDHLIVYKNLVENGNESIAGRASIYCLFTDPELGRVGLTEKEAREKGIPIKVAAMPANYIARAEENGETKGLLKAIVHAETKKIIGAAVLTAGGGELMSILQMAMMGEVTYDRIRDAVFAHPTFAESLNNLFARI